MSRQTAAKSETRLSIRADSSQKSLLHRAAVARHMNVSQFVLDVSLREAEQIVNEQGRIALTEDDFDWLVKLLDEPPMPKPRLRQALAQKPVWNA